MVLDVAEVVSALSYSSTKARSQPSRVLRGELGVLVANMRNVKLVDELVPISTQGFGEEVCRRSLADETRRAKEAGNATSDLLEKRCLLILMLCALLISRYKV